MSLGDNRPRAPNFDSLHLPEGIGSNLSPKMTGKGDPTISCSHLMAELNVLEGRKI